MEYKEDFYIMEDDRNTNGNWTYMPLKPEPDDMENLGDTLKSKVDKWSSKFSKTRDICESIDNTGYVFSLLGPKGHILGHDHELDFVSAILGLECSSNCIFRVGQNYTKIREGRFTIFDYKVEHEAWNLSDQERLVLLISLPNRYLNTG